MWLKHINAFKNKGEHRRVFRLQERLLLLRKKILVNADIHQRQIAQEDCKMRREKIV